MYLWGGGVVVVILYQTKSMLLHIKPLNILIKKINNNKFDMMCVGFNYGCRKRSKKKLNLCDM